MLIVLAACLRLAGGTATPLAPITVPPTNAPSPWVDESALFADICFEAALELSGQVFIFRDPLVLDGFYDQIDASGLCRQTMQRIAFDFGGERVLVGLWSAGSGCRARHEVLGVEQNTAQKTFVLRLGFAAEGACNYELVRPFWLGLDGLSDFAIEIVVQSLG